MVVIPKSKYGVSYTGVQVVTYLKVFLLVNLVRDVTLASRVLRKIY